MGSGRDGGRRSSLAAMTERRPISGRRMKWLEQQLAQWRAAGLVDEAAAASIAARYEVSSRARAARLLLVLGCGLLAVGIIWLVASNVELDEVGPFARIGLVAALWLGLVVLAEIACRGERFDVLAGPLALLAAAAFGATIFQVAQSLQVPAYEPWLLAAWAAGALAYAYATGSAGPLVLGVGVAAAFYVWLLTREAGGGAPFVVGVASAVPLATAAAVLHAGTADAGFAAAWRLAAAWLALLALGAAAIPGLIEDAAVPVLALATAGAAVAIAAAVALRADRLGRLELAVGAAVAGAALVLTAVAPERTADAFAGERLPPGQLAHTLAASALFLALAVGTALLGVARASPALTNIAIAAIVLFVAVQSFGLIAPLFSGAALVLAIGAILVACGLLADRGRRHLLRDASQ